MRKRQHVNPRQPAFERFQGERPRLVAGRAVEVEVGCAEAQFLFERARLEPERTYVGLEIRHQLVDWVNRAAERDAQPVQAVFCHANHHLAELFAPASVDRIYLNFPDPWFKRRHHVRRLIDRELAEDVAAVLRPGGALLVQSDVWPIALEAMAVFDGMDDRFVNCAGEWSFWRGAHPFGARSWREQHCEENGLPIWRLLYRGQDLAPRALESQRF